MEKLWASFKLKPSTYQSRFHRFVAEKIVNRFLEIDRHIAHTPCQIHRHTGGLEKSDLSLAC